MKRSTESSANILSSICRGGLEHELGVFTLSRDRVWVLTKLVGLMAAGRLLGSQVSLGLQQILLQVVRTQRQHAPRLLVSLAPCLSYLHTSTPPLHMQKEEAKGLCRYRRHDKSLGILKPLCPDAGTQYAERNRDKKVCRYTRHDKSLGILKLLHPAGGTQYPSEGQQLMHETQRVHSRWPVPHNTIPEEAMANPYLSHLMTLTPCPAPIPLPPNPHHLLPSTCACLIARQ